MDEIEHGLRRILAPNPSPMTFTGTNTWIVGKARLAIIDPGPDDDVHLDAIEAAIGDAEVAAILVTHSHLDHSALAPRLASATGAPVLAAGPSDHGRRQVMRDLAAAGLSGGGEGIDTGFAPDRAIAQGDAVETDRGALAVVETPGHMANHVSFAWEGALFSGDLVMGWASTLISPPDGDLTAYMASLERLAARPHRTYFPGHGDPVHRPAERVEALLTHRRARGMAIRDALQAGHEAVEAITRAVYTDVPDEMHPAAMRNALAHLIDLWERGEIAADPSPALDARWALA